MEQPTIEALPLNLAHGSAVAVRENTLRTVRAVHCGAKLLRDCPDRFVPADLLKLAAPFGAGSPKRVQQSIGVIDLLEIPRDFVTKESLGELMLWIAANGDGSPVFNSQVNRARIRAVKRANCPFVRSIRWLSDRICHW